MGGGLEITARLFNGEFEQWCLLSDIDIPQKNKYQVKFTKRAKAYQLYDVNNKCIADIFPGMRRRMVYVVM
jgi:hypothetical protein